MLLGRMAFRLSLLSLATWTTLPGLAAADATTTNATPEILNFVPPCAQNCFSSFIVANFDPRICGSSPSLQCLCRQRGSSGYTLGEGATSCLVGEGRFGACQDIAGIDDATATAYNMCVGVSKAEPQTHDTIVATLVIPASGTGPLLVPTAIQTASGTGTSTGTATVTVTPTVSLPTGPPPEPTTTTAAPPAATTTATASPAASDAQPQLSSAQIAAIALGCVAVVVFGILLVLLARCVRRRRFGDLEAGFSKMRDSMSFGRKSRPGSAPGQSSGPLPQARMERNLPDPRWQLNMRQPGVGLAISPAAASPAVAQGGVLVRPAKTLPAQSSPLPPTTARDPAPTTAPAPALQSVPKVVLSPPPGRPAPAVEQSPPKPTLTLAIPRVGGLDRVPPSARDSVVTEFAEDGEGDIGPGTAIWRPPATDPQSATTYYFADKVGNWVLRSSSVRNPKAEAPGRAAGATRTAAQVVPRASTEIELPSPDHKTRSERAKDAYGGFSPDAVVSPLRLPQKPGQGRLGSPIAFRDQRREPQLSSPSLSARLSQTAETITGEAPTKKFPPDTYLMMMREARDLTGGRSRRRSVRRSSRRVSQESATSIESAAAVPFEDEDDIEDEPQVDLSPVAESPQTPISPGKSPVSYPKIHKRNNAPQVPAPSKAAGPGLLPPAHQYNVWHPPGRSSPTGAGVAPATGTATTAIPPSNGLRKPWNAPGLNPANPGQPRTGSPETRAGSVTQQYWRQQRQVGNPASYWNQPQKPTVRSRPPPPPTPPYELPGENSARRPRETPAQPRRPARPTEPPTPQATPQQPAPTTGAHRDGGGDPFSSSQSSLLAKRRGADKAAALTLASGPGTRDGEGPARKGKANKPSGWKKEEESYGPVPITPGWVPELTPTRKGDDLYLNVR